MGCRVVCVFALICAVLIPCMAQARAVPGCPGKLTVRPEDGQRDVPLNAEIQVVTWQFGSEDPAPESRHVFLFDENDAPVELVLVESSPGLIRMRPRQELKPTAEYRILLENWKRGAKREQRFRTGALRDTTPPSLAVIELAFNEVLLPARLLFDRRSSVEVEFSGADDLDRKPLRIVYAGETSAALEPVEVMHTASDAVGASWCSDAWSLDPDIRFVAVAVLDLAGNESRRESSRRWFAYVKDPLLLTGAFGLPLLGGLVVAVRRRAGAKGNR